MVGVDVHVLVLRAEVEGEGVGSGGEVDLHRVAPTVFVPVVATALRHDNEPLACTIDRESANGALVLGVDRAIAVGVVEGDKVFARSVNADRDVEDCGLVVACVAERIIGLGACGTWLGSETFHTFRGDTHHLILAGSGSIERGGMSAGHFLAILQDNVFSNVFNGVPHQGSALEPCYGSEGRVDIGGIVHADFRHLIVGHYDIHLHLALGLVGGDERSLLLAIDLERLDLAAVTRHSDVERCIAVFEIVERPGGSQCLRHERTEGQAIFLEVDTEENLMGEGNVAAQTP